MSSYIQGFMSDWVSRFLVSILLCTTMFGCPEPFRVASRPTHDFPETWEKRLKRLSQGDSRVLPRPAPQMKQTVLPQTSSIPLPPQLKGKTERIAVLELMNQAPQKVSKDEISYLTNELRTVASYLPTPKFLVLTQESLETLIEPSMKLEDCVGSCAVETGRIVGARWILTGEIVKFGSSLRVSLKLHDTQSGHFLKGAAVKGKSVEDLEKDLHAQALSLVKEVSPEWGKWLDRIAPGDLAQQLKHLRRHTN